jgi:hypothetical protein
MLLTKYYSSDKTRTMRWEGHVECIGRRELHTGFWWGDLKEEDYFEDYA